MNLWQRLASWMDPEALTGAPGFELGQPFAEEKPTPEGAQSHLVDAKTRATSLEKRIDSFLAVREESGLNPKKAQEAVGDLAAALDENVDRLKQLFFSPRNADLVVRRMQIGLHPPVAAALAFLEGMSDKTIINESILKPLMLLSHLDHHLEGDWRGAGSHGESDGPGGRGQGDGNDPAQRRPDPARLLDLVQEHLLPGNQVVPRPDMESVAQGILYGDTAVFIDGVDKALMVETKGFPVRSVSEPKQEMVIRGPMDAFVEAFRPNVALVRRRLKDPRLITDILHAGKVSRTFVAMLHLNGVANPRLVAEVKRRVEALNVDTVGESGILEQLIEDSPQSIFPQVLSTERPDRVAAYLSEGHVALIVDNSPFALVVPVTWWSLLQTSEDYYLRAPFGTFLRGVRVAAMALAVLAGGVFVAAVNFHHEMIPTELMLGMASAREVVPFPAVVELLVMEFAFELLREAGVRIPSVIGPIIGIVGALILGQAAVEARLISPVVIIIFAVSGLASFAIPNYAVAFGVRIMRFLFIGLTSVLGIYGMSLGVFALGIHLARLQSFGVPYLAPVAPHNPSAPDMFGRGPIYRMENRPGHVHPLDPTRQGEPARAWDPLATRRRPGAGDRPPDDEGAEPGPRGPVH